MRWTKPPINQWHRWFAWYPVRLEDGHTTVWLETVERLFIDRQRFFRAYRLPERTAHSNVTQS